MILDPNSGIKNEGKELTLDERKNNEGGLSGVENRIHTMAILLDLLEPIRVCTRDGG
jgi:hypothetical protein